MNRLDYFANCCKDVKVFTPQNLYEAIHKLGPLPLYHLVGTGSKRPSGELTTNKDDIKDKEPAKDEAYAVYKFARQIAVNLINANSDLDLPELSTETDPFLGLQTIQEWCIKAQRIIDKGKRSEDETDEPNKITPEAATKKITHAQKKAYRSYEWVCKARPNLVPVFPQRYSVEMYEYVKDNYSEYNAEGESCQIPEFESWKRYLRQCEQVNNGLKNSPRAGRVQPKSAINPDEIEKLSEITNQFKSPGAD